MKLKNFQNEIEAKSHEGSRIVVTRRKKAKSNKGIHPKDGLDMLIINVSVAIGVLLVVLGVNMAVGGYFSEIPSMLGLW